MGAFTEYTDTKSVLFMNRNKFRYLSFPSLLDAVTFGPSQRGIKIKKKQKWYSRRN